MAFPSITNASGIWKPNEVSRYVLDETWPFLAETSTQFGTDRFAPSRIVLPTTTSLNLGTSDLTIEFWMKTSGLQANYATLIDATSNNQGPYVGWGYNNGGSFGKLSFRPGPGITTLNSSTTVNDGVWRHFACVKSGANGYIFINGSLDASISTWSGSSANFSDGRIGGSRYGTGTGTDNGVWAELFNFRMSNTARYTSAFTRPSSNYTNDANTVLLLTLDSATPTDLSSNGFSFQYTGALLSNKVGKIFNSPI